MKYTVCLAFMVLALSVQADNSKGQIALRCPSPIEQGSPLYSSDFKWGYELSEMIEHFGNIYQSNKRLPRRAYFDKATQRILLPFDFDRGGAIEISETFVKTVARHIERAFELKIIDAVFFPDMGHSHLMIPQEAMKQKYDLIPVNQFSKLYQEMFADPSIKILYHTAEQLTLLDENQNIRKDPQIKWRHYTRNLVGENNPHTEMIYIQEPSSPANTAREFAGHYWWGGGFNLSANKDGCFEYRRGSQVFYFDLSMYDLESDPNDGGISFE